MRMVIDDMHFMEIADSIYGILTTIKANEVYISSVSDIKKHINDRLTHGKIGKDTSAKYSSNNHFYEIIYTGDPTEWQLCGYLNLYRDEEGYILCCATDYNEEKQWEYSRVKITITSGEYSRMLIKGRLK